MFKVFVYCAVVHMMFAILVPLLLICYTAGFHCLFTVGFDVLLCLFCGLFDVLLCLPVIR